MPFRPAPRLASALYVGVQRYFLTICVDHRRCVFVDAGAAELVTSTLRRASADLGFGVIVYCVMPDHVHALVDGLTDTSDFREFVRQFKQQSAYAWKQRRGTTLWQRGYYEHVLRDGEDTIAIARYILANPVRAGLVDSSETYPFSGSFTLRIEDLLGSL